MEQINFNNYRDQLTDSDKQEIFEILSERLREKNRALLQRRLFEHMNLIPYHGILERIIKDDNGWSYCAGQSYPDEIRTVRRIILELN